MAQFESDVACLCKVCIERGQMTSIERNAIEMQFLEVDFFLFTSVGIDLQLVLGSIRFFRCLLMPCCVRKHWKRLFDGEFGGN